MMSFSGRTLLILSGQTQTMLRTCYQDAPGASAHGTVACLQARDVTCLKSPILK